MSIFNIFRSKPVVKECDKPCSKVIKIMTDREIGPNMAMSVPPYTTVDGYRYVNITVRFNQAEANEPPVELGVMFAYDQSGEMGSRFYANLEAIKASPQVSHFIEVTNERAWHGSGIGFSTFITRIPVMAPYMQVFPHNKASHSRTVSIWAYLVS